MLSKEDNELLTRVGPCTPMGELFRRFWLPALLADELPGRDCVPVRVRLLGEDLVAFRDTNGQIGLVDAFCPHRGAPLFFGRNEEAGLRCIYHGWKFDVDGNCVDMPNCVEGETFKAKVRLPAYPVWERAGIVWAYLGPAAKVPPKPAFEWLDLPDSHRYVFKYLLNCNYMQSLEGEIDPSHSAFLHSTLDNNAGNPFNRITGNALLARNKTPDVTMVDTEFGAAGWERRSGSDSATDEYTVRNVWMMPCFSLAGALSAPGVYPMNMKVPIDDEHTVFFRLKWSEQALSEQVLYEMKHGGYEFPAVIPGTFIPRENQANDYLIDRIKQRYFSFTGISNTPMQDIAVQENQRGPIMDRTRETLTSADKCIIHVRRRLMDAAKALVRGEEPAEAGRPQAYRARAGKVTVPAGTPVEEAIRPLLAHR